MEKEEFIEWIYEIKEKLPQFINKLQTLKKKGFHRYSLTGDYWSYNYNWGLGNSVFALKCYYSIMHKPENLQDIFNFIKGFQQKNGFFSDPLLKYRTLHRRIYQTIKNLNYDYFTNIKTLRAETRQSLSILNLYNEKPKYEFSHYPKNEKEINTYLSKLKWNQPWEASAHFGALIFFIATSMLTDKLILLKYCFEWISKIQHNDGCWYKGNPSLKLKINGAMKVFTAIIAAKHYANYFPSGFFGNKLNNLIDTVLSGTNEDNSCENFNITFSLKNADSYSSQNYRHDEIEIFMKKRLEIYKKHYFPKYGAFSFNIKESGKIYYGMPVSKGYNEPDIHGTMMFLWGLSVIGNFWQLNKELGIKEHIA